MNNLTTRKIVLGLLMALVLAFSVQGTADAITGLTRGSGDLQLYAPGQNFTVSFSVGIQSPSIKAGYKAVPGTDTDGNAVTIGANTPYYEDTNATGYQSELQVSYADAYNYDQEAIDIAVVGATLTKVGTYDVGGTLHSMSEGGVNAALLTTSSVTLTLTAAAGTVTITITDETIQTDRPDNVAAATPLVFTVYIAPTHNDTSTIALADGNDGLDFSIGEEQINTYFTDVSLVNVRVTYTVSGSGSVYVKTANNKGSGVRSLTTSSEAPVFLNMGGSTNKVTISVVGQRAERALSVTYIYSHATLTKHAGDKQAGAVDSRLANPLVVRVTDGKNRNVSGVQVNFTAAGRGSFLRDPNFPIDLYVPEIGTLTGVKTNSSGLANVFWQLGATAGVLQTAAATLPAATAIQASTVMFTATFGTKTSTASSIVKESGDGQRANKFNVIEDPLVVTVRDELGQLLVNARVEFLARDGGALNPPGSDDPGSEAQSTTSGGDYYISGYGGTSSRRVIFTDSSGQASVRYSPPQGGDRRTVSAGILGTANSVIFAVNGAGSTGGGDQNTILITLSSTTGEPGEEVTIRVSSSPSNALVTLGSNDFGATRFSPQSDVTPFTSTLLLPVEEGTHSFFATGGVLTAGRASVTVEAELGELSITAIGSPEAGLQTFSISAVDADGDRASAPFTARLSGTGFTSRDVEIAGGRGNARLMLPTAASLYTLTASAEGYTSGTTQVRIAGTGQQQVADEDEEEVEEEVTVAAEPDSIEITGPSTRSGTVNEELDTPLLVRVLDDDGDGLEGARVFYRVISGRGRLSARGNGRAIGVVTDSSGYARAVFTPLDGGTITVRANTDDLSATVEFTITTGSAPGTRDAGTGVTPGASTTPGTISPVVHVAAASRPPMLWVDGGAIYALVGASPQRFAASVDNALNITVAGGKVYWTEKTGESGGTINSANLNGSGVTELASIFATPMGIAVDVTNSKLYWTNSAGRIQSANLNGSRITNVIPGGLESPMDLALAGGNAYWTQGNGSVRFVNLRGTKQIRNISTGTDTPGSLVIGGGKVYWTETAGESGGTVNSANLNGTGATQLASILAAPVGIAVDGARSKLYWSNARGRIQSANLDGSKIQNVVSGLGSPSELVLSNSIATPTAAATTTTTTASNAKYDVNSDGSVDNTDAGLVADAMGTSNARYDVNGDGTVNFLDLLLVFDNRDPGAAGAPTIVGMKMSAAQIDIIEEQIDLLIATNDRSPSAMRVLVYLQQLLVTARPEKTQLLANYPNPFNPETWIPYELATDTNVRITIYNTQGVVIRSLQFGHQSAGYYTGRDRAAYWDGRNALGEQVASGLYFYQLETDEMSLMRKMVILK